MIITLSIGDERKEVQWPMAVPSKGDCIVLNGIGGRTFSGKFHVAYVSWHHDAKINSTDVVLHLTPL